VVALQPLLPGLASVRALIARSEGRRGECHERRGLDDDVLPIELFAQHPPRG
jgi:hypothetical protein